MKKKPKNEYVIRKVVRADSIAEALTKEKRAPVVEVILVSVEKSRSASIGFGFSDPKEA